MAKKMKTKKWVGFRCVNVLMLMFIVVFATGCTTSHIRRDVSQNPLPKMAQFAQANDYKVTEWNGTDHLRITKNVNWGMLLLLRRDRFVGDINYRNGVLEGEMCLEMREFLWYVLFIPPATMELKPQLMGCAVTSSPRKCANELFEAAGLASEWR
jgi:hypothetical protein